MTMDKSAIEQIQQAHATQEAAHSINQALAARAINQALVEPELDIMPICALPQTMVINNLEKYLATRIRHRGVMSTSVVKDYAEYVKGTAQIGAACFIDPDEMHASTILNMGDSTTQGHCDYRAYLKLKRTSEYNALIKINGDRQSQKDMAEWLEDWRDFIVFFDSEGIALEPKRVIAAIRRLTIDALRKEEHEDGQYKTARSALEQIEVSSKDHLPAGIRFSCIPYKSLPEHSFECRLSIITGGDAPKLVLRVVQLDYQQEIISEKFMDVLEDALLGADVEIYRGGFAA